MEIIRRRRLLSCMVHCNGLCYKEKNINAAFILELNSKCTSCEIAYNSDEYRCYCCSGRLRKRSTRVKRSIVAKLKNAKKVNIRNRIIISFDSRTCFAFNLYSASRI